MNLEKIVRENIWQLKPYSCARDEFSGEASVWLDANESPYNNPYNRYPDPLQSKVKAKLAGMRGAVPEQMFLGVGSDECIDTVYRVFCNPPYGRAITDWVEKAYREGTKDNTIVVMLIPARTDTRYFHDFIQQLLDLFIQSRTFN